MKDRPIQIERLLGIDRLLRGRERQTNASLSKYLEVSDRTIRTDLRWMQDRYCAPIEFSTQGGWHYTDPEWRLPTIPMSKGELFALTLGARMLEAFHGTTYALELRSAIARLGERLPQQSWVDLQQLADDQVSFRSGVHWEALADGLMDAALLARMEVIFKGRPPEQQCQAWIDRQISKINAVLKAMSTGLGDKPFCSGVHFSLSDVAVGCALGYLDFRFPQVTWRDSYANLAKLNDKLVLRASFIETAPQ